MLSRTTGEVRRRSVDVVDAALRSSRVVVVTGARQAGKTTLVRQVLGDRGTLQRLDDEVVLQAARADPATFAAYGPLPRAIDEVQRGGDALIRAIKAIVDIDATPGQFLLDGSADFLTVPTLSESLAGRAAFIDLWPFSQGELDNRPDGFLEVVLNDPEQLRSDPPSPLGVADYLQRLCAGGFPEAVRLDGSARRRWFANYVRTVTQRDITELTGARKADHLPRLLRLLAARTAGELVLASVHDAAGLGSRSTTEDYIGFLGMTYLIHRLPAWSRNLSAKAKRHPKVYVADTGLAAHLLGKEAAVLSRPDDPARGPLMETFVVNELRKQQGWIDAEVALHHLRDRDGAEVDVVIEASDGRVVGIEVKASATVTLADFRWLAWLRDKLGDQFVAGVILYTGERPLAFGDRLIAAPISALWLSTPERPRRGRHARK
jgi:predicted AAA+ superfamily ATPase